MASYEVQTTTVIAALAQSSISQSTQAAIALALNDNTGGTTQITTYPDGNVTRVNLVDGTNVLLEGEGDVNLLGASNSAMAALDLILFTDNDEGAESGTAFGFENTVTINNKNFAGVIVLNEDSSKVSVKTTHSITVETGSGNDSVVTGSGNDSVTVVAGTDTVKTSAGNDKVIISDTYISQNSIIDGGTGKNILDLSAVDVNSITGSAGKLVIGLDNGGSLTASHFQSIILSDADISASKVALNLITGIGDDLLNLGTGRDSVNIAGGHDSINTGAGNDKLTFNDNFIGNAVIDGGEGSKDQLNLTNLAILSATKDPTGTGVHFTLVNGSTIDATNIEDFVYDTNGSDTAGGIKIVGVDQIIPLIEG